MFRKLLFLLLLVPMTSWAQFNTDRLVMIGRSALYYEDYVLSIQYFNQAITAKPYLFEPWYYRAVAKYYLDDYVGAEGDCTEAISRNPYVVGIYELRGLCRIQQKNFTDAIADYNQALRYDLDTMSIRWSRNARVYAMKAQVYLLQKDTAQSIAALDKSLELDAYDGHTWAQRSLISLAKDEWKESEEYLNKAIHLLPKDARLSTCCPRMQGCTSTVRWRDTIRITCEEQWPTTTWLWTMSRTTS